MSINPCVLVRFRPRGGRGLLHSGRLQIPRPLGRGGRGKLIGSQFYYSFGIAYYTIASVLYFPPPGHSENANASRICVDREPDPIGTPGSKPLIHADPEPHPDPGIQVAYPYRGRERIEDLRPSRPGPPPDLGIHERPSSRR